MTTPPPLYVSQFFSGVVWSSLGPLLDSIMRDLDVPLAQGGLPAASFFLGGILGVLGLNFFLARVPLKRCLVGMASIETVALAAAAFLTEGTWSFALAYFFVGMPCLVMAGVPGMWISVHVREKSASALNFMVLSSVTAMVLTPFVLGMIVGAGGSWRWVYAGEAVLSLLTLVTFARLPLADIRGRENLRLRHLKAVVSHNPRLLLAIGAAAFMYLGAETVLVVWLPKFEVEVFGAGASWAGLSVTFYWVGQITGRLASIPANRRFLPSFLLAASVGVMAVFAGALAASPGREASLVLAFAVGLASSSCFSHIASYSSKFSLWHAGVVFSVFQIVGGLGGVVFPYITGPVAAAWGLRAAIAVSVAPLLLVVAFAFVLHKASGEGRTRGTAAPSSAVTRSR